MFYRLITGSTHIIDPETGEEVLYTAWDNNTMELTTSQARSLGPRVIPMMEVEEEEAESGEVEGEDTTSPRRRGKK